MASWWEMIRDFFAPEPPKSTKQPVQPVAQQPKPKIQLPQYTNHVPDTPFSLSIDHVVVAGMDLNAMRADLRAVGLESVEGGTHEDGLIHDALISFADGSYLELIAPVPGKIVPEHPWWPYMVSNAGVCAWAIRSTNIEKDVALYRSRGIAVDDVQMGGRTRPDGVRLEWRMAVLHDTAPGTVLPFLIQDVTPREWRVPPADSADTLITGVKGVLLNLDSHDSKMLCQTFGLALLTHPVLARFVRPIIYVDFISRNASSHLSGVILASPNNDAARERHYAQNYIFEWDSEMTAWTDATSALIGFTGKMTRPPLDLALFQRRLEETVAWCTHRFGNVEPQKIEDVLEVQVLGEPDTHDIVYDYSKLRERPHWGELDENDIVKRIRHTRGYESLFNLRAQKLVVERINIAPVGFNLASGQLLAYDVSGNTFDGAMLSTTSFFRDEDAPLPDSWVYYDTITGIVFCWIYPNLLSRVEAGLDAMTLRWYWWVTGNEPHPVVQALKSAGYKFNVRKNNAAYMD